MSDTVLHVVGHVGSDVDHKVVAGDKHVSRFRLATTPRHWNRAKGAFVDDVTNWLTVECWRTLALNVASSVRRGQPVVVVGKLRTQEWVKDGNRSSRLFLEATAIGHDLSRGVASFTKMPSNGDTAGGPPGELAAVRDDLEDPSSIGRLAESLAAGTPHSSGEASSAAP